MGTPPLSSPRVQTARQLVLGGIVVELAQTALIVGLDLAGGGLAPILLYFAAAGIVWALLIYLFAYRWLRVGEVARAKTPTLVFAILSIVTIGVLSGILLLVAYHSLDVAEEEARRPAGATPPTPLRTGSHVCAACGRLNGISDTVCSGCGLLLGV